MSGCIRVFSFFHISHRARLRVTLTSSHLALVKAYLVMTDMATSTASTANHEQLDQLPISTLQTPHRDFIVRAVANVLSCPLAQRTYAQIVDGLPLLEAARDSYNATLCSGHALLSEHIDLCPGVAEQAAELCSSLDPGTLLMPSKV